MKKLLCAVMVLACVLSVPVSAQGIDGDSIFSSAKCAVVMDGRSGEILYEKNPDTRSLIASTTKIMTALVVLSSCTPDEIVTVAPEASGVEGSSAYLKNGEKLTVRELLYCLMLSSGNDSAAALAIHVAGSIEAFAEKMNDKARELGLLNTSYKNPHGLDADGHYSTARDLAILTRYALGIDAFREIVSTKTATVGNRSMQNHNKLLWNEKGCIGVKTGYTKAAGRILVSAVERDGRYIICVTIHDSDDYAEHSALYKYIDEHYTCEKICRAGESFGTIPVVSGTYSGVDAVFEDSVSILCEKGDEVHAETELPSFFYGGITKGDVLGKVTVRKNGEIVAETNLLAASDVPIDEGSRLDFGGKIKRLLRISFKYGGMDVPLY